MKLTNPNADRPILANVKDSKGVAGWHEIPAGEAIDVEDYVVATTLVEYGATASKAELEAARALHADRNRQVNSRTASASASEGRIIARQQATVDVATGTVDELKGDQLKDAVRAANEAGAEIKLSQSAGELREQLAAWQAAQGASTDPAAGGEFEVDEAGELILDENGAPIPAPQEPENGEQ